MKSFIRFPVLALLVAASTAPAFAAKSDLGRPELRGDDFVNRVAGAYGVLPAREPQLTDLETAVLTKVAELIRENPEHARNMLENLLADGKPVSAAFNQVLGVIYHTTKDYPRADAQFREAIRKFPDFQRAWASLGTLRMEIDDYRGVSEALSRAIELGASDQQTYGMLGYALLQRGELAAAEVAYNLALLRAPNSVRWLEGKARILAEQGRHTEVLAVTDELLAKNPRHVEYWRLQANAHFALGNRLQTIRSLEIARSVGELDARALHLLGGSYMNEGIMDRALDAYLAALKLDPKAGHTQVLQVAHSLLGQDQFELARRLLATLGDDASFTERQKNFLNLLRGRLSDHDGRPEEALAAFGAVLANDPLNAEALYRSSMIHAAAGRPEQARLGLEKIKSNPEFEYGAQLALAKILIGTNQLDAAMDHVRTAYRLRPSAEVESLYSRLRIASQSIQ